MSQPFIVTYGPWMPDGADTAFTFSMQYRDTPVPCADILNVYWAKSAYRSLPSFVGAGTALPSACLGAFTTLDANGNPQIYSGAGADLYHWNGSSWTVVSSSSGAYPGATQWQFAVMGGCVLGVDGIHPLQDISVGGSAFAPIAAAPVGKVIGVIGQFCLIGNIPASNSYRVQWSAIGDPTQWPTPLTDAAIAAQSGYEDLDQEFGEVMFIGGGPQMGVVLQRHGITRLLYQGGDVVFSFTPYERKRGVIAPGAAVQVGEMTHFISDDGFYMTDGSTVTPTGTMQSAGLDQWFWSNVNLSAINAIESGWDADKRCVCWAIPTGVNTEPDTLIMFNPLVGYWTKAALPSQFVFTDNDGIRHRLGIFSQSNQLGYLTGAPIPGYCETYDLEFTDGNNRSVSEAQPNIQCTDTPTMQIGTHQALQDALTYSAPTTPDAFSRRCTWDPAPEGRFIRARTTSQDASAIAGTTLYVEITGTV